MNGNLFRVGAAVVLALGLAVLAPTTLAKDGGSGGGSDDGPGSGSGGATEITGIVQSMPASGLVGGWKIAGTAVTTGVSTAFDQEDGILGVGAVVEVKGTAQSDGSLLASKMEVKVGVGTPPGPGPGGSGDDDGSDITGPIINLPASGLLGSWNVNGHTVIVVSTTQIDQEEGAVAVGAIVEVEGMPDPGGAIVAAKIEVKTGAPGLPGTPTDVPAKVEVVGLIEMLPPSGLIGNWTVGGRTVIVAATTVLDSENGPFVLGASVEAKGALDSTGALTANKIETTEGNGAPEPALEFWGTVVSLPGTTGFVGVWKIDDKLVDVTAATKIDTEDAPLVVGVNVEVHGWVQPDGMIEASEIETRTTTGMVQGQGTKAVEFFNPALGHFFVSANPTEVAALDAAGKWQRTGQSFNVGAGTSGVCRFYGMPPKGPDSHFFTADPAECQAVMTQFAAWTFEGHAFSATPPVNGQCPAGTLEVHRFFNNPTTASEINHRFTVTPQAFAATLAMGWIHEGVVMCAQP